MYHKWRSLIQPFTASFLWKQSFTLDHTSGLSRESGVMAFTVSVTSTALSARLKSWGDLQTLRLVTCHIGNGCSLAAIQAGRSIDTTMGFTPLEGLMMGSRSGSIDPGILIYLLRQQGYSADQFDTILNKQSGLKGVSGESGDMRA